MIEKILNIINSRWFKFLIIIFVIFACIRGYYKKKEKDIKEVLMYMQQEKEKEEGKRQEEIDKKREELREKTKKGRIERLNEAIDKQNRQKIMPWTNSKTEKYTRLVKKNREKKVVEEFKKEYPLDQKAIDKYKNIEKNIRNATYYYNNLNDSYKQRKSGGNLPYGKKIKNNDFIYLLINGKHKDKEITSSLKGIKLSGNQAIKVDLSKAKGLYKKMIGKKIGDKIILNINDFMTEQEQKDYAEIIADYKQVIDDLIKLQPHLENTKLSYMTQYGYDLVFEVVVLDIFSDDLVKKFDLENKAL